jgi:hypothetical protein
MLSKNVLIFGAVMLLSACGSSVLSEAEFQGTVQVMAATQIVGTQRALPTNTQPPPVTLTPPTKPTETPVPTATTEPTLTETSTRVPASPTAWFNPNETAPLRFDNKSGENIFAVLSGTVYGEYSFSDSWNLTTPWGDYSYLIWIGDEGPYGGSFTITNRDKYTLVIETDKVHMVGP